MGSRHLRSECGVLQRGQLRTTGGAKV
jgi:hypothetical protein